MFKTGDVLLNNNGWTMVEVLFVNRRVYKVRNCGLTEERWEAEFTRANVEQEYKKVKHTPKAVRLD